MDFGASDKPSVTKEGHCFVKCYINIYAYVYVYGGVCQVHAEKKDCSITSMAVFDTLMNDGISTMPSWTLP